MQFLCFSQSPGIFRTAHEHVFHRKELLWNWAEEEIGGNSKLWLYSGLVTASARSLHYHLKEMISTLFNSFRIMNWLTWPVKINLLSLSLGDQLLHDLFTFPLFSWIRWTLVTERTNVSGTCRILVPLELIAYSNDYFNSTPVPHPPHKKSITAENNVFLLVAHFFSYVVYLPTLLAREIYRNDNSFNTPRR